MMADGNIDIQNVIENEIGKEQEAINTLIESLLKYKIERSDSSGVKNKSLNSSTPITSRLRSTHKPTSQKSNGNSPLSVPVASSSESEFPINLIVECFGRLNNQNRVLAARVDELQILINKQDEIIKDIRKSVPVRSPSLPNLTPDNLTPNVITPDLTSSNNTRDNPDLAAVVPSSKTIDSVVERVERLENNINSRILLCRGPAVAPIINSSTINNTINSDLLKAKLCSTVCGDNISGITVNSLGVSLYGKNRNLVKIECTNNSIKEFLLQQARLRKPRGIYITEFLSSNKLNVYNDVLKLKKSFPSKIKAVYSRKGDIFCRTEFDIVTKINSQIDLLKLRATITEETVIEYSDNDEPCSPRNAPELPNIST